MVDLPNHNFIRWSRPDGSYINFETMDGKKLEDQTYIAGYGTGTQIPQSFLGKPGILTTMTAKQLKAYHEFTIALAISWAGTYQATITAYKRAIAVDDTLSDSLNNLAWTYTVVPDVSLRNAKEAVSLATRAATILADGDVLDTLACAYESLGENSLAIQTETLAKELSYAPQHSTVEGDLQLFQGSHPQQCTDPHFGTDPHPFREPRVGA